MNKAPPGDPNDEMTELERAVAAEQEAFRTGELARQNDIKMQSTRSGGGDINHENANIAGERAAERHRLKILKGRPPGVYVKSPIKVHGTEGPLFAPVGFRLTDTMVEKMGDKQIAQLSAQELVDDLR